MDKNRLSSCTTCRINLAESSLRNHNQSETHRKVIDSINSKTVAYSDGWHCLICNKIIPCGDFNRLLKKHFKSDEHINKTYILSLIKNRENDTTGRESKTSDDNKTIVMYNGIVSQSISDGIELKRSQNNEIPILDLVQDLLEMQTKFENISNVIDGIIVGNFMSKLNVRPLTALTGLDLLADIVANTNQHSMPSSKIRNKSKKQRR